MKRLKRDQLSRLLNSLATRVRLYAPVTEDNRVRLTLWRPGEELCLDYINPENSLKDVLYPQTAELLAFSGSGQELSIAAAPPPAQQVVFGSRPCDAVALAKTARVFTEGEFGDEHYRAWREATTIITVACQQSGPHCFCRALEVSPADARGSDVMVYPQGEDLFWEAITPRGEELLGQLTEFLVQAPPAAGESARAACAQTAVPAPASLEAPLTQEFFEHPYWEELAGRCLSCGICTYVCPTCYCFSLFDSVRGTRGRRLRGWDSCQFKDFALMAGGHNPRPTTKERIRQRFMHKLAYFPEKYGELHCVGCGRCVAKCPVGLHILGVIRELEEVI